MNPESSEKYETPARLRPTIHVVAGALVDDKGKVLICSRPPGKPMSGRWEFPGGKLEHGESALAGLQRELVEELAVKPVACRPLIRISHQYAAYRVMLEVFRVDAWQGDPVPKENQSLAWVVPDELKKWDLLEADYPIITALRLPPVMLVTPEPGTDTDRFIGNLLYVLQRGVRLVQFRVRSLAEREILDLGKQVVEACHAQGTRVVFNALPELALACGADGVHFNSIRLMHIQQRPQNKRFEWVGASCHNPEEIIKARNLGLDYLVVGPVLPTMTHPGTPGLGFDRFRSLITGCGLPVYAIGGMGVRHCQQVFDAGGQGIAAIRSLWPVKLVAQ